MHGKCCCKLQREPSRCRRRCAPTTSDPTSAWPGNFEFAVVADFDDLEGYQVYRDNPEHREIIGKFIQPIAAQRAAVQYEF